MDTTASELPTPPAPHHNPGSPCPACGGPLGPFGPDDACVGVRCLACDYVGAVTTNRNHPAFDKTAYDVSVAFEPAGRLVAIARVGVALGVGVAAARWLLDTGSAVARGVTALEVQRLHALLRCDAVRVEVRPPFPWRLGPG